MHTIWNLLLHFLNTPVTLGAFTLWIVFDEIWDRVAKRLDEAEQEQPEPPAQA